MYEEILKYKYLRPIPIENKEYYYKLIYEISDAFTSRLIGGDLFHSANINLLIDELGQLLANSIELYEWGYFDNAYYSLRSANELATIMLDLSDKTDWAIKKNMELFLTKRYRKKRYQIINWLSEEGIVFKEVIDKMPNFKEEINELLDEINQVIHMSGRENLYSFRRDFDNDFHENKFKQFENHFLTTIKILAIFRLIIDPFPLLLKEEEVYYRCPDLVTSTFSGDLLNLIGEKTIKEFKQTKSYISVKNTILSFEKRNEYVNNLIIANYIDLNHLDEIYSQKHLINKTKLKFLDIVSCSDKIIEIKTHNGIEWCMTSSNTSDYPCLILDDKDLINIKEFFNIPYKDIYRSILNLEEYNHFANPSNLIYIFHEKPLDNEEIDKINKVLMQWIKNGN